jgi:ubiquinone/menaquinone biosynthesis C-methylase UbiE
MEANGPGEIFFDGAIHDSQGACLFQRPDIAFWIHMDKTYGPKVLELACGTGRITIPAFENGVDIDGIDFSESMLRVARERAAAKSLPIRFSLGDIREIVFRDQ